MEKEGKRQAATKANHFTFKKNEQSSEAIAEGDNKKANQLTETKSEIKENQTKSKKTKKNNPKQETTKNLM